jgi:hypothetical protein
VVTVTDGTSAVSTTFPWAVRTAPPTCLPNTVCIDLLLLLWPTRSQSRWHSMRGLHP